MGTETYFPIPLPKRPSICSYGAGWSGVGLEILDMPPGETPSEVILEHYVIGTSLGEAVNIEQTTEGKYQDGIIPKGNFAIFPYRLPMQSRWDKPVKQLTLHLSPKLLAQHSQDLFGTEEFELPPIFCGQDLFINQLLFEIKREFVHHPGNCKLYAQTMANALAAHLLSRYSNHVKPPKVYAGGLSPNILVRVTDYINDNLVQDIKLEELAVVAQLSQSHFSRAFKQSTGLSPYQYVIKQRVERAKQLLPLKTMSLEAVAIACGFTHQSHLTRHFKRLTGLTPRAFQKL